MIQIYSKIGQGKRNLFEKLVSWYGQNELIPVYPENNIINFYMNREVKSTEIKNVNNAQQSGNGYGRAVRSQVQRKFGIETLHQLVTTSNQLEGLVQMSKWEMREKKKTWKQKFPEPKNPTSRMKQVRRLKGGVRPSGFKVFFLLFLFLHSGAQNLMFLASIAARFLSTLPVKKTFFEPSRVREEVPLGGLLFSCI